MWNFVVFVLLAMKNSLSFHDVARIVTAYGCWAKIFIGYIMAIWVTAVVQN
jgi:hypothetical protein